MLSANKQQQVYIRTVILKQSTSYDCVKETLISPTDYITYDEMKEIVMYLENNK